MEKQEFEKFFKCFTDSAGNPVGKGNLDSAFISAEYESLDKQIPMEAICSKWKAYIDQCIADKTQDKYIKTMENFIKDGTYNNDYGGSLKGKQSSWMDKYNFNKKTSQVEAKEPVKENPNAGMTEWLKTLPEGEFSMAETDGEAERKTFIEFLQRNKRLFFEEYHFVIKQVGKDFNKIIL